LQWPYPIQRRQNAPFPCGIANPVGEQTRILRKGSAMLEGRRIIEIRADIACRHDRRARVQA